jgi:hypothetical protein
MDSLDNVLENQPSYAADLIVTGLDHSETLVGRVTSKAGMLRLDVTVGKRSDAAGTGPDVMPLQTSMLLRPGKPTLMLLPGFHAYTEFAPGFESARTIVVPSLGIVVPAFWLEDTVAQCPVREAVGPETVGGHPCVKIKCAPREASDVTYLFSATDLDGLVIKMLTEANGGGSGLELRNITLNVDDGVFDVPDGYRQLDTTEAASTDDT